MPPPDLSPGPHTFHSPTKNLTFEYIIHTPSHHQHNPHNELLIIQPPAWGLGSEYLQTGLAPLLNSTQTTYRLLFFHPRGTNNSSRPSSQGQMSTFELATDLEDLRLHLDLEQLPTLLGHSNGGAIALAYAELYPSRVARLILLDSQVLGLKAMRKKPRSRKSSAKRAGSESPSSDRDRDRDSDSDSKTIETLRRDPRYTRVLNSTNELNKSTDEAFTASVNAKWALYFSNPGKYVPELRAAIGDRVMPLWCYLGVYGSDRGDEDSGEMVMRLGEVKAKTLMINGREDWICRVAGAERTRDGIPGARLVVCEECGHFPWIEARERTMGEIVGFIGS